MVEVTNLNERTRDENELPDISDINKSKGLGIDLERSC